jgi:hypothetical protein
MHEKEQVLGENRLTAADWDLLQKAYLFLEPFDGATLFAEGNKASLSQSLFLMECLLSHYENEKVSHLLRGSEDISALIPHLRYHAVPATSWLNLPPPTMAYDRSTGGIFRIAAISWEKMLALPSSKAEGARHGDGEVKSNRTQAAMPKK